MELNTHKRTITITGLCIYNEKKDEIIKEVQCFIEYELGLTVNIEDVYFLGQNEPPMCVTILSNLQEKRDVMKNKSLLKGVTNRYNKPIFINDYWPAETNERRKFERDIYTANQTRPDHQKVQMDYKGANLYIGDLTAQQAKPVQTPNPMQILDLEVSELNRILRLIICRGEEIHLQNSRFVAYSALISSYEEIQEMYLKVKLLHPAANHVICAYQTDLDDIFNCDFCDDGEHGAGRTLLTFMKDNNLTNRVIFVVRYYGGSKLGPARFECIVKAARSVMENSPTQIKGTPERVTKLAPRTRHTEISNPAANLPNSSLTPNQGTADLSQRGHHHQQSARGAKRGTTPSKSFTRGNITASRKSTRNHLIRGRGRGRGHYNPRGRGSRGSYQNNSYTQNKRRSSPSDYNTPNFKRRARNEHFYNTRSVPKSDEDLPSESNIEDWSTDRDGAFEH